MQVPVKGKACVLPDAVALSEMSCVSAGCTVKLLSTEGGKTTNVTKLFDWSYILCHTVFACVSECSYLRLALKLHCEKIRNTGSRFWLILPTGAF